MSDLELIKARRAEIAQMRKALDAEDGDLEVTERTLVKLHAGKQTAMTLVVPVPPRVAAVQLTIKGMIRDVLTKNDVPWTATSDLWNRIRLIHHVEINKNSFYPQIKSMEDGGEIIRNGKLIALRARVAHARQEAAE